MASYLCSSKILPLLFLVSAVPAAILLSLERATPPGDSFRYRSGGLGRESVKWDDVGRRFLVSFMEGGLGEIRVSADGGGSPAELEEIAVVRDLDVAGNASLGLAIDRPRNRVLVVIADLFGHRYSALAAYDLATWKRIFLTRLNGPGEKSFADDVAVDPNGIAYVTDARLSKIWRVGVTGELQPPLESPLFIQDRWYKSLVCLNGIVFHPHGFLLVVHTSSGNLYKVEIDKSPAAVKFVKIVDGSLLFGDGLELLSPTKLAVAGNYPSGRLVESSDGWETAAVIGKFSGGPAHRMATATTVKDGKVFISHVLGLKKHSIVEAVF